MVVFQWSMSLVYSPRKEAFFQILPHTLTSHLLPSWLSSNQRLLKNSETLNQTTLWPVNFVDCKIRHVCSSALDTLRQMHLHCTQHPLFIFQLPHIHVGDEENSMSVLLAWQVDKLICMLPKRLFGASLQKKEEMSSNLLSDEHICACLSVCGRVSLADMYLNLPSTTPKIHLCSSEMGNCVVNRVGEQVLLWYVCVFGGGSWGCWIREASFWHLIHWLME